MNRLLFLLVLISFGLSGFSQQIELKGRISIFNSKYNTGQIKYVSGASIYAYNAKDAVSDDSGCFNLEFVGIKAGKRAKISIERFGYEVVYPIAADLENIVIGSSDTLPVYMATPGQLADAQLELLKISKSALHAQRDSIIAKLHASAKESRLAIQELENRLKQKISNAYEAEQLLNEKIKNLEKDLPEYALELAKVNLDVAAELYLEAYAEFTKGNIERVIKILSSKKLNELTENAFSNLKQSEDLKLKANDLEQKAQSQIQQAIDAYLLKAKSFKIVFRYDSIAEVYENIINISKRNQRGFKEMAWWYIKAGHSYNYAGQYLKALKFQKDAIEILKKDTNNNIELAYCYEEISHTCSNLGMDSTALDYQSKGVTILETLPHDSNINLGLGSAYTNLGYLYNQIADSKSSLKWHFKALEIKERLLDPADEELAYAYNSIAITYSDLKQYSEALNYYFKSLNITEKSANQPKIATCQQNIGYTYFNLKDYIQAFKYLNKSIEIKEQIDPLHPDLALCYYHLALTFKDISQIDSALFYQIKAINLAERKLPINHRIFLMAYTEIIELYLLQNSIDSAFKYQLKAIPFAEIKFKEVELAEIYVTVCFTGIELKKREIVIEYAQKALKIYEEIFKASDLDLATAYGNIGILYFEIDDFDTALLFQLKAISIRESKRQKPDLYLIYSYSSLVNTYIAMAQKNKALEYQEKIIGLLEKNNSADTSLANFYTGAVNLCIELYELEKAVVYLEKVKGKMPADSLAIIYYNLAYSFEDEKQFKLALEYYEKCLRIEEDIIGAPDSTLSDTYSSVARCQYLLNDYVKAIQNFIKARSLYPLICDANYHYYLGRAYARSYKMEQAKLSFSEYEIINPNDSITPVNWFFYYALLNDNSRAIAELRKAINMGYKNLDWIKEEKIINDICKDPLYVQLLNEVAKKGE